MTTEKNVSSRSVILGGLSGNIMEWYDFAVYGYFAPVIAQQFFPSDDPLTSLIATFGAFAAGFLVRPLGGILFGHLGDRVGRKFVMILSGILMAVPSFLIGVLPTYSQIGVWAAVLLILLRIIQGLSVGGEYTTSIIFLAEHAKKGSRGFMASWSSVGAVAGALLGSAVGALFSTLLTDSALHAWGWRLAFILSILVGAAAMYLSKKVPEVSLDKDEEQEFEGPPIWEALRTQKLAMLRVIGIVLAYSVGYYLVFLYITTFLIDIVKIPASEALDINTVSMLVLMCLLPLMAKLSDKIGRKPVLITASLGLLFFSYPLFWMMHHHQAMIILSGQLGFAVFIAAFAGTNPVTMVEAFPSHLRCSAMSFAFNVCFAIFGGTTPMVAAYLIQHTHEDLSIAFMLMGAGLLSLIALLLHPETAKNSLR